ncbi:MAG TPA: allophanate hydrolase [Steroidobacteraceae bacterium]|jgi:allophanate hydrolase
MKRPGRQWSVCAIATDVSGGVRTAQAVAREALSRARDYDKIQPQAWISRATDEAVLAQAERIDRRVAAGESLPLAGVPVAIKDNIDVLGLETTAACPAFAYRPERSAPVVERLTDAGALILGKTNLDQFATGLVGTRSPYGAPGCVFNREYVSGGSSSGSAVLVAAGVVPLALGTDTAGSGRVPAAFNSLIGFKPTKGRWSTRGLVPACRSLDCITTLTANAADAARVDSVLTHFDREDPFARRAPTQSPTIGARFRLGVPRAAELRDLAPEDATCFAAAVTRLQALGATLVEVSVARLLEAARLLYGGPWVAERTEVLETLLQRNPSAIHPVVQAIVQAGKGFSAVDAFRGLYALQRYARDAEELWEQIDVLVLPTTPTIYRISELLAEPVALNARLGLYTNFVNLLDMTAIAVPAGFRANATGVGVSLIGPAWSDTGLLDLAARYEDVLELPAAPGLDLEVRPSRIQLGVVGAHLAGMPLHWQLTSRAARFVQRTRTAPVYRLYAMISQSPAKPALVHAGAEGAAIEVEVYELDVAAFGSFVGEVPPPLAIGTVTLADGSNIKGFLAEPRATVGALDITAKGGWRAYLEQPAVGASS